jgi:hypothetical protein
MESVPLPAPTEIVDAAPNAVTVVGVVLNNPKVVAFVEIVGVLKVKALAVRPVGVVAVPIATEVDVAPAPIVKTPEDGASITGVSKLEAAVPVPEILKLLLACRLDPFTM